MALLDLNTALDEIYTKEQKEQILQSFNQEKYLNIFRNSLLIDNEKLEEILNEKNIKFEKIDLYCYKIPTIFKSKLSSMNAFNEGKFYIQNYSSYLCAKTLGVKAGENVLDMCAAPGGKSLNLANFMQNEGYLASCELSKTRFFTLKKTMENYQVKIAKCFLKDARTIGKACPLKFDKILLDAPCSTFAKMGFEIQKNTKEIKQIANLQKKLLHSALLALKHGGELVYSTCTFLREENEAVLENALRSENFKLELLDFDLLNVNFINAKSDDFDLSFAKRVLPDNYADGFFIAKVKKH
ncbi:RsmB/NOP family class I SAM-dependent RNA methyltransferase [Campylobacter sp. IFREMER_LSEM_CL1846]|uniref:RsmB/NOP family class I SAM-dependent RNA methyltransferase n=1 Tax=unclassified Campylobacter TaxID=2593542 RepID=UPI0021E6C3E9|nr:MULTISPECIES: RsmB/NOP family class I SAM-dependent RNA methyltransferase [unclassified Campylobacter]HEC1748163.1 RsmB/NOP family class I SAM-dependent RNA methyltransferase [Campylobacter lari]MCV3428009.1 RsmB/NOP family class I SAM-dependent RNA methyltransferase [Campylobacter sp. IFREMER_LSEM_CL1904]MCV3433586.1 RsmB/NOP family class I SAM-dependent RNA methyltransferase [Campylobacter sp. IFREMER_LSEM_CL1846]MCV3478946.1 RsmB/NOP family class I SAM-dependent RNA methyltransferase [Cam